MTATAIQGPVAALSDAELSVIEARLNVSGLFTAHAHTDMTRLLAELRRLRAARTPDPNDRERGTR